MVDPSPSASKTMPTVVRRLGRPERLQTTHQAVPSAPGAAACPSSAAARPSSVPELAIIDGAGQWLPDRRGEIVLRGSLFFGSHFCRWALPHRPGRCGLKKDLTVGGKTSTQPANATRCPGVWKGAWNAALASSANAWARTDSHCRGNTPAGCPKKTLAMATEIRRQVAHQPT